jgi:formylglycine-generating enzyme required for sulfatase activity
VLLPRLVPVPAGTLEAARGDGWARPETPVAAYRLGATQVTNREWAAFVEATGREESPFFAHPEFRGHDRPVVAVSWLDAEAYLAWLSAGSREAFRLPSEDEWEWAARGGLRGALYPWGDEPPESRYPDYPRLWISGPERVGTHAPNGYGLHEMCENVHEWCAGWHDAERRRRPSRGGSWRHQRKVSRCDARSSIPPHFRYADYGFRVALPG